MKTNEELLEQMTSLAKQLSGNIDDNMKAVEKTITNEKRPEVKSQLTDLKNRALNVYKTMDNSDVESLMNDINNFNYGS